MIKNITDKTTITLPIALAFTICAGLIIFGGTYFGLKNNVEKTDTIDIKYSKDIKDIHDLIDKNEAIDREERAKIRKEESDRHKEMSQLFMQYLRDEVGGLRADWERGNDWQKLIDSEQNRRLNKLD